MILNLTQHVATPEQVSAGVVEPKDKSIVQSLLTFNTLPDSLDILDAADELAELASASGCSSAMIGVAPFLMSALESALMDAGVQPVYAFSIRESADQTQADGSVRKVAVFRHVGFVPVSER